MATMAFLMWKNVLARSPRIELSEVEFSDIVTAWRAISTVVSIEEEWECLIQNYIELEMELLQAAMHAMVLNDEHDIMLIAPRATMDE